MRFHAYQMRKQPNHPESLGEDAASAWREQATARLGAGNRQLSAGMIGHAPLFEEIDGRRFSGDAHEEEAAMLLDPEARLGANGNF